MTAVFRETDSLPPERRPSIFARALSALDAKDVMAGLGFLALAGGAGLNVALTIAGALLLAGSAYLTLRRPKP